MTLDSWLCNCATRIECKWANISFSWWTEETWVVLPDHSSSSQKSYVANFLVCFSGIPLVRAAFVRYSGRIPEVPRYVLNLFIVNILIKSMNNNFMGEGGGMFCWIKKSQNGLLTDVCRKSIGLYLSIISNIWIIIYICNMKYIKYVILPIQRVFERRDQERILWCW